MKRVVFVMLFVMVLAPAAWAQVPFVPSFEIGVGGGLNMPMGDIGDGMNNGYNFNASVGYSFVPMFVIGAEFGIFGNGGTDEVIAALGPNGDFNMTAQQFTAMVKYVLPVAVHNFYGKGLAGAYRMSSDVESSLGNFEVSDTKFGFGLGGGFQFKGMSSAAVYAEGIYHRISGETSDGEFATFNLGVLFSFN
ncbi:MAG: porin family protein [Candidatus Krumholzibacteria bacterium]|nr:porin family protein [Candidatus Krumholzibacteria bacterium]